MIKPHRVVYLYHDRIDAIGDKLATEAETFHAVRQTIDELADLTAKIVNSLNGNQVLITADHGFLFQERPLDETDKNKLSEKPPGTVLAKKRYLLGHKLPDSDQAFHGSTAITAGTGAKASADGSGTGSDSGSGKGGDMEFWIPKGANRFHFVGGARFVHGGAMPQEIAVPVIRVQHLRGSDKAAKTQVRTVGVSVLGNNFKVTTNRHRFQLIQTEPVGERVKPATLKIALYDGEELVTNLETLTFDSTSKDMNQWKKTVSLTLEGRRFDSKRVYQLLIDAAFFDRFHAYIPGWEVPKMRPEFFTNRYGLITDYLAEFMREMRKRSFSDAIDRWFTLGKDLNQRDSIAVRRTVSGLLKLLYPAGDYDKDTVRRVLMYAMEAHRRVKEQLKKIGGMEFYEVHFSFIDQETREETFVSVPEQGGDTLIPDGPLNPGVLHTICTGSSGHLGLYRLETQTTAGNGKFTASGLGSSSAAKEASRIAYDYFKANVGRVSGLVKAGDHDFHLHTVELHNTGPAKAMTLASFVALCSGALRKPLQPQLAILGDMSLGGSVIPVENLAECLQVAFDSGAKRILLPMASVGDIASVPGELFAKFQTAFYADPVDAAFKAVGVE